MTSTFTLQNGWEDPRAAAGLAELRVYNEEKGCPVNYAQFSVVMESENGDVQAVARMCSEWNWIFLNTIYVYDKGQGVGRQMMEYIEKWAKDRKYSGVNLATSTFQTPAFYEALGYEKVGEIENFVNGYDRLFYAKRFA